MKFEQLITNQSSFWVIIQGEHADALSSIDKNNSVSVEDM